MAPQLGLTPDGRWDFVRDRVVSVAAGAGFTAVGVPHAAAGPATAAELAGNKIDCHELLALIVSGNAEATLKAAHRMAAAAAAVGAEWVLTVFGAAPGPATTDLFCSCAQVIAESGARMAVEFSPLGPVDSIPAALEVVDLVGADRAGILIDTWHFFRGGARWSELESVPLDKVAYLQFDDALALGPAGISLAETMDRRVHPGLGVFDLERFAHTFLQRGWNGLVSVEVLNAELSQQPVAEFARAAYAAAAPYWA